MALNRGEILILFDEPTQGLDVEAKDEIYALMNGFAEQSKGDAGGIFGP